MFYSQDEPDGIDIMGVVAGRAGSRFISDGAISKRPERRDQSDRPREGAGEEAIPRP